MEKIILSKGSSYYIDSNKVYKLEKGSVLSKILFIDGKLLSTEIVLKKNDLLVNYLYYLNKKSKIFEQTELEIKALEDSLLTECQFNLEEDYKNLIYQLLNKINHNSVHHIYGKQIYVLYALKNFMGEDDEIKKSQISYEYFNISRSQFYLILSNLKDKKYIYESDDKYILNKDKIDQLFNDIFE